MGQMDDELAAIAGGDQLAKSWVQLAHGYALIVAQLEEDGFARDEAIVAGYQVLGELLRSGREQ